MDVAHSQIILLEPNIFIMTKLLGFPPNWPIYHYTMISIWTFISLKVLGSTFFFFFYKWIFKYWAHYGISDLLFPVCFSHSAAVEDIKLRMEEILQTCANLSPKARACRAWKGPVGLMHIIQTKQMFFSHSRRKLKDIGMRLHDLF